MKSQKRLGFILLFYLRLLEMRSDITLITLSLGYKGKGISEVDRYVPLGVLYLTAVLEAKGYGVDFRDFQLGAFKEHSESDSSYLISSADINSSCINNLSYFLETGAEIVGISCMSDLLPLAILAAEKAKKCHPGKVIILGGIGPGGAPEKILKSFPFIDIIVKGEGEETIIELLGHLAEEKDLRNVRGISFRKGDRVYDNSPRERIRNPDEIPFPAYHRIDFSKYSVPGVLSTRGCPFGCAFCDVSPFWGSYNRARSIENVIAEIRLLADVYGRRYIEFVDDTFTLDRKRILGFCKKLREERVDIKWSCCGRIDMMDEELMEEMSGSGCIMVAYGVESGSDHVLKCLEKGFSKKEIMDVLSLGVKYFDVLAYFMWGFPFETMEDFRETIDFISTALEMGVQPWFFSFSPLPLSRIYKENRDGLKFSGEFCSNYLGLLKQENAVTNLIKQYPEIFPGFYYCDPNFERKHAIAGKLGLTGKPMINSILE